MELSEEELRQLRALFGKDVPIVTHPPKNPRAIEEGSWFERIAGTVGLEKWMWKSRTGMLLAILIVPPGVTGLFDFWAPPIRAGFEYAEPYLGVLKDTTLSAGKQFIAFMPKTKSADIAEGGQPTILAPAIGRPVIVKAGLSTIDATVYRITRPAYDPLDGFGTSRYGGRWNSPGPRLLYASDSVLAALGELRRQADPHLLPHFMLHELHIQALAEVVPLDPSRKPTDLSVEEMRKIGDDWIRRDSSDVLMAVSLVDPSSHTLVVNLAHADRMKLAVTKSTAIHSLNVA